jgi:hypothetical protein
LNIFLFLLSDILSASIWEFVKDGVIRGDDWNIDKSFSYWGLFLICEKDWVKFVFMGKKFNNYSLTPNETPSSQLSFFSR